MNSKSLHFFGSPRLQIDGSYLEIKSRKGLALLAYLAVMDQKTSRDRMAALLWPEYDQTRARANLRRTLYNLNQTPIGDLLVADPETIYFEVQDDVSIDVQQFTFLLNGGNGSNSKNRTKHLAQAVDLYQDQFLTGFYLPDSDSFETWVTTTRERFQRQAFEALAELGTTSLEAGNFKDAEHYARRELELDNLKESAWRQLMTVLVRAGRRAEALAEYERCRQILWDELGVEPAPETAELAASLRTNALPEAEPLPAPTIAPNKTADNESPDAPIPASPYRGLFAFREVDAPNFFGREDFAELLNSAISKSSIVAVIGPSGSGKSSVVNAGLLAEIRSQTNWIIASFRPGQRPFSALAAALVDHLGEPSSETARLGEISDLASALEEGRVSFYDLITHIREHGNADRVLLVADQFEELFTFVPDDELRQRFLDIILELVFDQQFRQAPIFSLVLTLRADFTGQALAHRPLGDAIQDSDVKLGPMTRAELRRAVLYPARKQEVSFEPGLVARILDDVGNEPGNLPLLEFALANLWEQQESGQMTHKAYEAIGRVEGALARHADDVFENFTTEKQALARRIFIQLVRPGEGTEDTRRLATQEELGEDWSLMAMLADSRLVVTGRDADGNETAEIVHEALIRNWRRLREWMESDRSFRVWQERLRVAVREWEDLERDSGALLRGVALTTAESQMAERSEELSDTEKAFITAGVTLRKEQEIQRLQVQTDRERLRRRFTLALGIGLVLALVLSVVALLQWREASDERDSAELARQSAEFALARQLAAQSETLQDERLDLALLLAVEGVQRGESLETQLALNNVLEYSPGLSKFIHLDGFTTPLSFSRVGLSSDGLIAAGVDDIFALWDLLESTERPARTISSIAIPIPDIVFSPDGRFVATLSQQATPFESDATEQGEEYNPQIDVYDTATGFKQYEFEVDPDIETFVFSPDSTTLAVVRQKVISLWDITTGEAGRVLRGGNHTYIAFSPDKQFIAGGGPNRTLRVWDSESGDVIITITGIDSQIYSTAFSQDGRILAASSMDGTIRFWDTADWQALSDHLPAHQGPAKLSFSPDWQEMVSFGEDGLLQRWQPATQEKIGAPLRGHHPGTPATPVFVNDGGNIISAMIVDDPVADRIEIIEWQLNRVPYLFLYGHENAVTGVALDENRETILSVDDDGEIRNWQLNGQLLPAGTEIDWSGIWWGTGMDPTGEFLVRGSQEGTVYIFDTVSGDTVQLLEEPPLPVAAFDFTTDGRLMAGAGCGVGTVVPQNCVTGRTWVWNTDTWEVAARTEFESSQMVHNDVAISRDGRLAATGAFQINGDRQAVYLWDVATGALLAEEPAAGTNQYPQYGLAIGPDNDLLAMNGAGGFEMYSIDEEGQLEPRFVWEEVGLMMTADFSPDGQLLAAGGQDGKVYIWRVADGELLRQENIHDLNVISLEFAPAGKFLLTSGRDGLVTVIDLDMLLGENETETASLVEVACGRANRNMTRTEWERYFGDEPYRATCPGLPLEE